MAQDDIWDDSALVDSWNEALAEYKKYHSVFSKKGAKLEDVPGEQKTRGDAKPETNKAPAPAFCDDDAMMGEVDRETSPAPAAEAAGESRQGGGGAGAAQGPGVITPPIAVLGSVRDEGLKSLLMAWYYAGYYTGLYEGQQQSHREQPRNQDE